MAAYERHREGERAEKVQVMMEGSCTTAVEAIDDSCSSQRVSPHAAEKGRIAFDALLPSFRRRLCLALLCFARPFIAYRCVLWPFPALLPLLSSQPPPCIITTWADLCASVSPFLTSHFHHPRYALTHPPTRVHYSGALGAANSGTRRRQHSSVRRDHNPQPSPCTSAHSATATSPCALLRACHLTCVSAVPVVGVSRASFSLPASRRPPCL